MSKNVSVSKRSYKWTYFVFNWGSPIAVFDSAVRCTAFVKVITKDWGNPITEGALRVVRYRPSDKPTDDGFLDEDDLTCVVLRALSLSQCPDSYPVDPAVSDLPF